ncbi:dihydroorotase [Desulfofustis glycolicus]|uniref:Dihydroorotase n=1 Tax=Desulfofustis glycolicus DSM 9705 TaxID=1121409 RepID=A0A1M5RY06_9BACT|nr:amidohydrolase family protein [Desulfofustis glycolicus]MCB2216321.1 amidohydrolase family protein [Desulfobulbaceae bacterium]SHH31242.1 dihydroorotase [Desulfofustis glycolicus DSM 9705]
MKVDTLLTGGMIVTAQDRFVGALGIRDGRVACLLDSAAGVDAQQVIDVSGKYIIPGAIDAHVHFQDPGSPEREDLEHGTRACAVGGITTAISQPVNNPPVFDVATYRETLAGYEGRSYVDYGLHGGASSGNLDQIELLWTETGAPALKMMMCYSPKSYGMVDDGQLYRIMQILQKHDGLAYIHAENQAIVETLEKQLRAEGRTDPLSYLASRPSWVETEAVRRALILAEQTGCRVILAHVSCADSLEMIGEARGRGVSVFAESCPHFFTFIDEDIVEHGPYLKFSPVMRDEPNLRRLWELLAGGAVQTIGSDHCPYAPEEKTPGLTNIWDAPNGVPGLEVLLPVLLDGVSRGQLSMERLVEVTSLNPAKIYGLYPRKGHLSPGADADLVVVDPSLVKTLDLQDLQTKCPYSPYLGKTFRGWPIMTMVRGVSVAEGGAITGAAGHGRYVSRTN